LRKRLTFILFTFSSIIALAQSNSHTYDIAIKRLADKTWLLEREYINDTLTHREQKDYYIFPHSTDTQLSKNNIAVIIYALYHVQNDPLTRELKVSISRCTPWLNFFNSTEEKKNIFPIFFQGENGKEFCKLHFLSDSQFVAQIEYLRYGNKFKTKETCNIKRYFKRVNTPEEIIKSFRAMNNRDNNK